MKAAGFARVARPVNRGAYDPYAKVLSETETRIVTEAFEEKIRYEALAKDYLRRSKMAGLPNSPQFYRKEAREAREKAKAQDRIIAEIRYGPNSPQFRRAWGLE